MKTNVIRFVGNRVRRLYPYFWWFSLLSRWLCGVVNNKVRVSRAMQVVGSALAPSPCRNCWVLLASQFRRRENYSIDSALWNLQKDVERTRIWREPCPGTIHVPVYVDSYRKMAMCWRKSSTCTLSICTLGNLVKVAINESNPQYSLMPNSRECDHHKYV